MAGRHARSAPLLLTRGLATLGVAAILLAVGVLAVTVFLGGPPRAASDRAAPAPSAGPSDGLGTAAPATGQPLPTTTSRVPGQGGATDAHGKGVGGASVELVVTTTGAPGGGPLLALGPGASATSPGVNGAPPNPGVAQGAGWWLRSDAGRARGRALGILTVPGHSCHPKPKGAGHVQDGCRWK